MAGRTIICGVFWLCMAPMWAAHVQDSLVVDGIRFDYVSDVNIDSLLVDKPVPQDAWEWWLGAGWEVHASPANPTLDWLTSSLGSSRPHVFVERRLHQGQTGHTWAFRVGHHQPWTLSEDEVSPFVKGWIAGEDAAGASPLRQVVLIPDSLAWRGRAQKPQAPGGRALRWRSMWFVPRCGACSFPKTPLNGWGFLPRMCFKK